MRHPVDVISRIWQTQSMKKSKSVCVSNNHLWLFDTHLPETVMMFTSICQTFLLRDAMHKRSISCPPVDYVVPMPSSDLERWDARSQIFQMFLNYAYTI